MTAKNVAPAVEVKFKDLREAVVALNESGLVPTKIKLVGAAKEEILKNFMAAVAGIEDVDGKFPGPKAALTLYNDIVEQEEKAVKAAEKAAEKPKEQKAPKEKKEKKVKFAKEPKLGKEEKGPGVIASILEFIKEEGPITKAAILEKLAERFPERAIDQMKKTVAVQLGGTPCRMEKERGVSFIVDKEAGTIAFKS